MSERRCTCNWRVNLLWAGVGALPGNLCTNALERGRDALHESVYQGRALYEEASALRGEAAREESEAKHKAANAAFERSSDAGVAEALAQLGVAHCNGLGVPRSWRRGQCDADRGRAPRRQARADLSRRSGCVPEGEVDAASGHPAAQIAPPAIR